LSANEYESGGAVVTLTPGEVGVRADEHGLPIHGVLAAYPAWQVTAQSENSLIATLDFSTPTLLASFPFPHVLTQAVTLSGRRLTIETTVTPTASASVPLCFGYHPYFTIPGVPRGKWRLTTPMMRRLPVDERGIPTGAHEDWNGNTEELKTVTYDDGFDNVPDGALAPGTDDLLAIEPMTAPTDALRRGGYRSAMPGHPETARFSVTVT
jgi:aldose 1-epimerase